MSYQDYEDAEDMYEGEDDGAGYKPSLRERMISILTKVTRSSRAWYIAGVVDTLTILFLYKHFLS